MSRSSLVTGVVLVVFSFTILLSLTEEARAADHVDKVLTIYFAGTGLTEDWHTAENATSCGKGFYSPELLSSLYSNQVGDETNEKYRKFFVDGIGTGCGECTLNVVNQGLPMYENCRGWATCLNEALSFLITNASPSEKIILNLVGFSRGAVSSLIFADFIDKNYKYLYEDLKINILAFDPVPGADITGNCWDTGNGGQYCMDKIYEIGNSVKTFVGIYATDERSAFFSAHVPTYNPSTTKAWVFRVPGSHETIVGNQQKDGHAGASWSLIYPQFWSLEGDENFDEFLLNVSRSTSYIAVELLSSSQWGGVEFNNWNWHGGVDETGFVGAVSAMWNYDYNGIRHHSFVMGLLESYSNGPYRRAVRHTASSYEEKGLEMFVPALANGVAALTTLRDLGNSSPIANAGGPYVSDEGTEIIFDASSSTDPDEDALEYRWDLNDDGTWDTEWSASPVTSNTWGDDYTGIVKVEVSDGLVTTTATTTVTINNVAPAASIDSVVLPNAHFILPVVHSLNFNGSFVDPGWLDTHTATWDFGDETVLNGALTVENDAPDATGTSTVTHAYAEPGTYTTTFTVTDDNGGIDSSESPLEVLTVEQAIAVLDNYIQTLPRDCFTNNATKRKKTLCSKIAVTEKKSQLRYYQTLIDGLTEIRSKSNGYIDGNITDDWVTDSLAQVEMCMMIDDLVDYLKYIKGQL